MYWRRDWDVSKSKTVAVVHPDAQARILIRSILQSRGHAVMSDHSCSDLLADRSGVNPAVILLDRSLLDREGIEVLSQLAQKWADSELFYLPKEPDAMAASLDQIVANVERLLSMHTTRALLSV
jgi:FixJ family two-component response regulator